VPDMADTQTVDVVERCRVDGGVDLDDHDPRETFGWDKGETKAAFPAEIAEVAELQKRLFAASEHALLVVLQGIDASGKGGTVRSVMSGINPAGVDVNSFGVPSEEERSHDFLWRIHHHTPPKGIIGIFDRSHYEDVLVVRVKHLAPEPIWRPRYEHIRNFEQLLTHEGTHVVKLFLNVSNDKQRERLQDRVDSPDEIWKFRKGDLDDRKLWDVYREAFQEALCETSTAEAPWYVVPADRKWVRNRVVTRILHHHLTRIDPQYPPAEEGIEGLVVE
jgi:PPK2 family polyphosphate:nucleotide phosphotransferase